MDGRVDGWMRMWDKEERGVKSRDEERRRSGTIDELLGAALVRVDGAGHKAELATEFVGELRITRNERVSWLVVLGPHQDDVRLAVLGARVVA